VWLAVTHEPKARAYLPQRISLAIWQGNAAAVLKTTKLTINILQQEIIHKNNYKNVIKIIKLQIKNEQKTDKQCNGDKDGSTKFKLGMEA